MTQTSHDPDVFAGLREIVDNADARKVFGTPISQDGTIVLPVAKVGGGGGGGGSADDGQHTKGTGGGFGISAKPLGVYVLRNGSVKWMPAVDVNKIIVGGQLVAVAGMLLARTLMRTRSEARKRRGTSEARKLRPGRKIAALLRVRH
jgi:uncharacterized spore protein YtfJ